MSFLEVFFLYNFTWCHSGGAWWLCSFRICTVVLLTCWGLPSQSTVCLISKIARASTSIIWRSYPLLCFYSTSVFYITDMKAEWGIVVGSTSWPAAGGNSAQLFCKMSKPAWRDRVVTFWAICTVKMILKLFFEVKKKIAFSKRHQKMLEISKRKNISAVILMA